MKIFQAVYAVILKARAILIYIAISVMISNVTIGVFFRYVLNNSLSWTEELARYLMVWFGLLGMGLALKDNEHVSVAFFLDRVPRKAAYIIKIINICLVMFFSLVLFKYSLNHLRVVKLQISPSIGLPMYLPYSAITIGSFLMVLECVRHLYLQLTRQE
jgi:TRAP-type C4-dicarboxylate transport system permease small subunit